MIHLAAEESFEENALSGDPHNKLHARRMWQMLVGEAEHKENFKYISKHGVRSIGGHFLEGKALEELVAAIPEDTVTGFQLRDVFNACKRPAEIKRRVYEVVMFNKRFPKTNTLGQLLAEPPSSSEESQSDRSDDRSQKKKK
jgi:hypothetical protein